jgi:hypothetical protein
MAEQEPGFAVEKYRWLKQKRHLELLDLDQEVMEIPVLIQECGETTAIAIEIRESAKDDLDKIESKITVELLNTGKSATAVQGMIASDERYVNANALLSEARLDAGLWQSLMESLRTKSSSMRVAADLIGAGYITQSSIMEKRRRELRPKT